MLAGAYAGYAGLAWLRYGHPPAPRPDERDALLDEFMPDYEIAERHHIRVAAPAYLTFAAACDADLMLSPIVRGIFKARALVLGGDPDPLERGRGLLAVIRSIGWGVLAEVPGREIVMGAVTKPWEPNAVFHPLAPGDFIAFREPDYVKIVWTLRADPAGPDGSIFRHETRVATTDPGARRKFRRYWSAFSPGITLIRRLILQPIRRDAERRAARAAVAAAQAADH